MLKGNLSGFSLGEIFQSLAINKHTGTLTLKSANAHPKRIYFENGDIRFFSHGEPKTPKLGEILIRAGRLSRGDLEEALRTAKHSGKLVGQVLREMNLVSEDDIRAVLSQKLKEELYELFTWTEGEFEFMLDHCPSEVFDAVQTSVDVHLSTNSVIMEGLRRIDEWGVIRAKIPTENVVFAPTGDRPPRKSTAPVLEALGMIDGRSSVSELASQYAGPRFDLMKAFYDLLEAGTIRPLTLDEALYEAESARKAKNHQAEAVFLRHATSLNPEDPDLFVSLGDALHRFFQESEAEAAYITALRLAFDRGDWDTAASVAEKFSPNADLEIRDLQVLLRTFVELRIIKKALWAGQQLATRLQSEGETQKAAQVLDSLIDLDPADLNLKVQIATLFQQVGETTRATAYYEEVAQVLEKQKKIRDQIKILRIIAELNPKRAELKQKIATLVALQEKIERQRKRRLTIAGVVVIALVVATVIPLIYELKAREIFSHANRMEQISMTTGDFSKAKKIYEDLLNHYSLSTKAHEARLALQRISSIERSYVDSLRTFDDARRRELEERRRALEESIAKTLYSAAEAEAAGDLRKAHKLYTRAIELGKRSRKVRNVLLPVRLSSDPEGANVTINGEFKGLTPLIFHYEPGQTIEIHLSRKGCEESEDTVVLHDQVELNYTLPRRAFARIMLPSTIQQPAEPSGVGEAFVFPSRDGHVYAFDPGDEDIDWIRKVGRFGDRVSDLHVRAGQVYVGTVDNRVFALDAASGEPRWVSKIRGPFIAAPSTSDDLRRVGVANVHGEAFVIDNRTGERLAYFPTENEVLASPVFVAGHLVVGSTDNYVYGLHLDSRSLRFIMELTGPVRAHPVRYGKDVVFATDDGRVHRIDVEGRTRVWSPLVTNKPIAAIGATGRHVVVAVTSGEVLAVNAKTGAVDHRWALSDGEPGGLKIRNDILYVGYRNGHLAAWDMRKGRLAWKWQAAASINTPPMILGGKIYVPSDTGTVQVLEVID